MLDHPLSNAIDTLAQQTHQFTEADLDSESWGWKMYDQVRYAHLQTMLELRQLATDLLAQRYAQGNPPTLAQHILARHQAAFQDFLVLYLGLAEADITRVPAPDEWHLGRILSHVNMTEQHFFEVIRHALKEDQEGAQTLSAMPDNTLEHLWGSEIKAIFDGPLSGSIAYYQERHAEVQAELAGLSEADLSVPTLWWEGELFPVRFRMHRFEAHLREHTNQVEKTLHTIKHRPNEAKQLLRQVYGALADVEGVLIGAGDIGRGEQATLAHTIIERGEAVVKAVTSS